MTITNGYASLSDIRAWIGGFAVSDTADDALLEDAVEAASRWIDNYCGRRFWVDSNDTTRTYVACRWDRVDIDDLVTLTSLKTDASGDGTFETTWATGEYQLLPYNPAGYAESWPYNRIRSLSRQFPTADSYYARADRVQITGKFGWAAVPDAVKQACLMQATRIFKRRYSPEGVAGFGEFGVVRIGSRIDADVEALLQPYKPGSVLVA